MTTFEELRARQKAIWGGAADAWERHYLWFERNSRQLNEWLCRAAGLAAGMRVLDLACGSGQPALTAAAHVSPGGKVVATDLSPEMLAAAQRNARRAEADNVEFHQMNAEELAFPDGSFDAVTCRFGLMFCAQPEQAVAEIRRVLRPRGRFSLAVWDIPERNPFFTVVSEPLARFAPQPPPDPKAPGAFRLAPAGELEALLRAAGFKEFEVESRPMVFEYDSPAEYWEIQSGLAAPIRSAVETLSASRVAELRDAVCAALAPYVQNGGVRLPAVPLCASGMRT
jgi:SAM-dependent methyltransferase